MRRVLLLSGLFIRDLGSTLTGVVPLALAAGLFWVTFYYPVSADYLSAVGGWDLTVVCLATTLLLAGRANRAALYPIVSRLRRRAELPAAVLIAAVVVTAALAVVLVPLLLLSGRVTLTAVQAAIIGPRWLVIFLAAGSLGLNLSSLVGWRGSHLWSWLALGIVATAGFWAGWAGEPSAALARLAGALLSPPGQLLGRPADSLDPAGLALVLGYAVVLFGLAALFFSRKDLLWAE